MRYNPREIEQKWQKRWEEEKLYEVKDSVSGKENLYHLVMFPYPSGDLHIGHWYNFAPADIWARFKRMQGYSVLSPIGFDAFGLPAENAAIKNKLHPRVWTHENIERMRGQLRSMGTLYDWSREVVTCDPDYYKWTQWMFLEMWRAGLAEKREVAANWCPSCKTVLANEQVVEGACERCSTLVEQRTIPQWVFKITKYADQLLADLEKLDWPERTKLMQRNWIGRSEGALLEFPIQNTNHKIQVFTTRPDTLFGATYMVLAPEHPLLADGKLQIANSKEVKEYIEKAKRRTERERLAGTGEKTGVELKGVKAVNPAKKEEIPIWISDYVLISYGTGAIMAVPAHDQRDFEFAMKYNLPIRKVIAPHFEDDGSKRQAGYSLVKRKSAYCILRNPNTDEYLTLDWKEFGWHTFIIGGIEGGEDPIVAAQREIAEETGYKNVHFVKRLGRLYGSYFAAHKKENRLADAEGLLFELTNETQNPISDKETELHSFQWMKPGEVEKFINISSQKYIWEQMKQESAYTREGLLVDSGKFSGTESEEAKCKITEYVDGKRKVQYRLRDWIISRQRYWGAPIPMMFCASCAEHGKGERQEMAGWYAEPEKELPVLLPELEDYLPPGDGRSPLAKAKDWVKTKCPGCGGTAERETDTMDTFVDSSWYYFRYTDPKNDEKFADEKKMRAWLPVKMYIGGAEHSVLHLLYSRFFTKVLRDRGHVWFYEPFLALRHQGTILGEDGFKMSKSRGNVVDPDDLVRAYGADAIRIYLAFLGPYDQGGPWNPRGIRGVSRFLERAWRIVTESRKQKVENGSTISGLDRLMHRTVKKVGDDIQGLHFNTAIATLMTLLNEMEAHSSQLTADSIKAFVKLLAPFAPHLAEELWREVLKQPQSIHSELWPPYDPKLLEEEEKIIVVQVNGKVRDRITVPANIREEELKEKALQSERVLKWVDKNKVLRYIVTPRIVNIVVEE